MSDSPIRFHERRRLPSFDWRLLIPRWMVARGAAHRVPRYLLLGDIGARVVKEPDTGAVFRSGGDGLWHSWGAVDGGPPRRINVSDIYGGGS